MGDVLTVLQQLFQVRQSPEGTDSRYVSKQQLFVYTWRGEWFKDGGRERGREGE